LTPDGYFLSLQRIPHGRNNPKATKGVVLLQHGLTSDATSWVLNNPSESLPFILADNGYDVWMGNDRGNGISMTNIHYTPEQAAFWNFTWDQMASYDIPTTINYILAYTKANSLSYIGVSEGTTIAFAGFENPAVASKVNLFVALAPVAYVYHQKSLVFSVLADLDGDEILEILGLTEFNLPSAIQILLPGICTYDPNGCAYVVSLLMGPSTNLNDSRLAYYVNYQPNPTSVLNMAHWAQSVRSNVFQMYDYGTTGNMQHYNQPTPPHYHINKIPSTLPIALFTGGNDYLADPRDVATLIADLPSPPVLHHNEPTYAHVDYVISPSASQRAYPLILNLLATYNKGY